MRHLWCLSGIFSFAEICVCFLSHSCDRYLHVYYMPSTSGGTGHYHLDIRKWHSSVLTTEQHTWWHLSQYLNVENEWSVWMFNDEHFGERDSRMKDLSRGCTCSIKKNWGMSFSLKGQNAIFLRVLTSPVGVPSNPTSWKESTEGSNACVPDIYLGNPDWVLVLGFGMTQP